MNRFEELKEKILPVLLPYVRQVAVFGSFARGEETPESDIDLLVELRSPDQRPPLGLKWFGLEEDLSRMLGHPVEMVTESALSPYVRPYVEKDKVMLYDQG